ILTKQVRLFLQLVAINQSHESIAYEKRMTDDHRDFSFSTLSSIDPIDIPLKNTDLKSSSEQTTRRASGYSEYDHRPLTN
ncbi:unnamed protein product, partial [Rotaria sordida]